MDTKFKAYLMKCITNMHVGSGDTSYGVIDKMVQRDPVTDYPTIHASSLKGGLREHFEKNPQSGINVDDIFGKESKGNKDSESGSHRFLNADLVALPVRCTHKQFVHSFDNILSDFVNTKAEMLVNKKVFANSVDGTDDKYYGNCASDIFAEDFKLSTGNLYNNPFSFNQNFFMDCYATFNNKHFKEIAKNLPVIARNKVGENKNLWYEEIVPHQTIFITYIGTPEINEVFDKTLTDDIIQIGANASVGYGLCKFYEINFDKNE